MLKVKLFSSISFNLFTLKNKRGGPPNLSITAFIAINFIQYALMISENTNLSRIIIFNIFIFIMICFKGQWLKEFVNKELYL